MTEHRIATLAIRIFGLYVAFRGLSFASQLLEVFIGAGEFTSFIGSGAGTALFMTLLGVATWVRAERIAERALPSLDTTPVDTNAITGLTPHVILALAFVVLGLYFLAQAIAGAGPAIALWIEVNTTSAVSVTTGLEREARRLTYSTGAHMITGLVLLLGANRLAPHFERLTSTEEPSPPSTDDGFIEIEVDEPSDEA